ncbi:MAG: RNA polymerase factor sigma-54 [Planctomycetota bacterium]
MVDQNKMSLGMSPRMEQRLKLSALQIQAMEILQLQRMELLNKIKEELESNPTLEVIEETESKDEPVAAPENTDENAEAAEEKEDIVEKIDNTRDEMPAPSYKRYDGVNKKDEAIQNTPAPTLTLQDYIYHQFIAINITDEQRKIGEQIIYNIDSEGYLKTPIEEIAQTTGVMPDLAKSVLTLIQHLDPPGVGATSLEECLILQLDDEDSELELKKTIISRYLKDIEENRIPQIAKKLGLSVEELNDVIKEIEHLNPHPGADFDPDKISYVAPDVTIKEIDGNYEIILENDYIPRMRISNYYQQMAQQNIGGKTARDFIQGKMESAKRLINAIELRQRTLRRISQTIVDIQTDFFKHGITRLKSLKMKEVAKKLGLHISTISRAISNKYIQTPNGLFRMKFFFSSSTEMPSGQQMTQQNVLNALKEIVNKEDKKTPLRDAQIMDILKSKQFPVSRRTVAKYRTMLKIPSIAKRKAY